MPQWSLFKSNDPCDLWIKTYKGWPSIQRELITTHGERFTKFLEYYFSDTVD